MPVRFRCVYCNQLLGISRRKSGTIVRCTNCEGQIIVPEPVAEAAAASGERKAPTSRVNNLFEQSDIDDILKPVRNSDSSSEPFAFDPSPALPSTAAVETATTPPLRPGPTWRLLWTISGAAAFISLGVGYLIARLSAG